VRRGLLIAVAAGVALGSFSVFSDYFLINPWAIAGNIAGTWVLVAFLIGAFAMPGAAREGAIGGVVALLAADLAYYAGTSIAWDMVGLSRLLPGVITWGAVSVIAGPTAGAAGAVWRRGSFRGRTDWWLAAVAIGVLAAPLVAEGLYMAWLFSGEVGAFAGFAELALGLVLPVWLLRSATEWRVAYPTMAVVGLMVLVAMGLGLRSIQMVAGSGHL
jgi:hypothetical protein